MTAAIACRALTVDELAAEVGAELAAIAVAKTLLPLAVAGSLSLRGLCER